MDWISVDAARAAPPCTRAAQVQDLVEREKKLAVVAAELAKRLERERAELAELKEESQEAKELAERLPLQVAEAERAATQVKVEMEREAHGARAAAAAHPPVHRPVRPPLSARAGGGACRRNCAASVAAARCRAPHIRVT